MTAGTPHLPLPGLHPAQRLGPPPPAEGLATSGRPDAGERGGAGDACGFVAELEAFSGFGEPTRVETVDGVRYFTNEFWTSAQRQANRIHEVSYRACFKPQLPAFYIHRLTAPGDVVHDPFMGRGTTPVEAALSGRVPCGNDTNPLSRALTEPRLDPPALPAIARRLRDIPWDAFRTVSSSDLEAFYHPDTLARLEGLRAWFLDREERGQLDQVDRWIRMVAVNRLTGHSPGFFSVYTMPPNQAVSLKRQRIINARRNQVPDYRDVPALIERKSRSLLSSGSLPAAPERLLLTGQAFDTPQILPESVALTVTSPPFLDVVDYVTDNWLRCWFLGVDPRSVRISQLRSLDAWQAFIARVLRELARVTRPGGHVAFEVGAVRRGSVRLEVNVVRAAEGLPFEILGVMVNEQRFTKTSNCWGVGNNRRGVNSNRVVLLRKI